MFHDAAWVFFKARADEKSGWRHVRLTGVEEVKRKPIPRRKTLFVLVNEGTNAVREYLLIMNPNYLFGGPNKLQVEHIYSQLDFSEIAADGDWQRGRVERNLPEMVKNTLTMSRGSSFRKSSGGRGSGAHGDRRPRRALKRGPAGGDGQRPTATPCAP